jgi:hypothetical protein
MPVVPNAEVTYGETQPAARQLQKERQLTEGDLSHLRRLVNNLVADGYATDAPKRHFDARAFHGAHISLWRYPQAI